RPHALSRRRSEQSVDDDDKGARKQPGGDAQIEASRPIRPDREEGRDQVEDHRSTRQDQGGAQELPPIPDHLRVNHTRSHTIGHDLKLSTRCRDSLTTPTERTRRLTWHPGSMRDSSDLASPVRYAAQSLSGASRILRSLALVPMFVEPE